jgi:hypothetical protein
VEEFAGADRGEQYTFLSTQLGRNMAEQEPSGDDVIKLSYSYLTSGPNKRIS